MDEMKKLVFVCSRYRGDTIHNCINVKRICKKAIDEGHAPFAPHLFYPQILDDQKEAERATGISCSLAFLEVCHEIWVYADEGVSDGMKLEIEHATRKGITIIWLKGIG